MAKNSMAATINAASCSYADVSAAITSASTEDTINIPAGSCTWSSTLKITKGVNLIGAGKDNLTIVADANIPSPNNLIVYAPTPANASNNYPFRISGFTFQLGAKRGIAFCSGYAYGMCEDSGYMGASVAQTKIRIDNNSFVGTTLPAIEVRGEFWGVVDSNVFSGIGNRAWGTGSGYDDWNNHGSLTFGSPDNLYFEDNTFTAHSVYMITDCDQGGRYVYRYNNISLAADTYPLFDWHGGRNGDTYSCFSGEIYGNSIERNGYGGNLISQRGGKALGYMNVFNVTEGNGKIKIYDNDGCPPPAFYNDQLINDSYYFLNKRGVVGSIIPAYIDSDNCGYITEGVSFFHDGSSPNVGCGHLSSLPTACSTGEGYWVTNQSCTDLTGMIGANPATPISGTLYKCTATDTWTSYFTPYTYPHPLQNEGADTTPPAAPSGLLVL